MCARAHTQSEHPPRSSPETIKHNKTRYTKDPAALAETPPTTPCNSLCVVWSIHACIGIGAALHVHVIHTVHAHHASGRQWGCARACTIAVTLHHPRDSSARQPCVRASHVVEPPVSTTPHLGTRGHGGSECDPRRGTGRQAGSACHTGLWRAVPVWQRRGRPSNCAGGRSSRFTIPTGGVPQGHQPVARRSPHHTHTHTHTHTRQAPPHAV